MYKKSLIIVSTLLFVICICAGSVFATDGGTTENIKNGVTNVTDTVIDGVSRMGADMRNGISNAENSIENTFDMNNNGDANNGGTNNDGTNNDNNNDDMALTGSRDGYTTTRTTNDVTTNNTNNMWVWLIVAVAAIVIIGLVWYYGTRNNTTHRDE